MSDYKVEVRSNNPWQPSVADRVVTPAGGESKGDRYLVIATASGDFTGHENDIAQYNGAAWDFYTPVEGWFVWIKDEDKLYKYDGSSWAEFAGAGGDTLPIVDTTGIAKGSEDATKIVRLEVDGITTGITRVLTVQDKDYTIADKAEVDKTKKTTLGLTVDGGGIELTTGIKGYIAIPYNCTITGWVALADISGSIKIDVWKDVYANYPPIDADSITNGHEPEITTATKAADSDLGDWSSVTVTAGDVIAFSVDSITDITRLTLILQVTKT